MNLKKLFATSAILTLAVSTFGPAINGAKANFGAELLSAYSYAHERNVTTLPTVESAYPMGKAIRAHTAKMMSNWALAVLNKQPNEAINPVFTDIAGEGPEMQGYIIKSAQQGLMGQGIEKFMPQQDVTRAQFGTVLSRALFGNKYDGGTPYYANHLANLKKLGIMNDLNNPERPILRYEIWLMLQRAEKLTTKEDNEGLTPEQILGCLAADDYLACIEKAKDEVKGNDKKDDKKDEIVRKGNLDVSVTDYSSTVKSAPKGIFVANTVRFAASEDVKLDSLTLKRIGLGTRTDIDKVWLEKNGIAVTNAASVGSDGLAVLNFKYSMNTVTDNKKTQDFDLVIQLNEKADNTGNEFAFELTDAKASAKDISVKGMTNTFRVSGYTVVELTARALNNANTVTYKLGNQSDFVIGEFRLQSDSNKDDRDISVKSLTFRNDGTADFGSTFKNVRVYRDSKVVSNNVEANGRDVVVSLDKDIIKANRSAVYTIRAEVAQLEKTGETVKLQLRDTKDIIADEEDTSYRANIKFDPKGSLNLAEYKFDWGRVLFESKSGFPRSVNAGVGTNDVVIAEGKIAVTESVELPKIEIKHGTDWTTSDTGPKAKDAIKRLVLEVDGARYTADQNEWNFSFDGVYVRRTSDVKLLISLDSKVKKDSTIEFKKGLGSLLMGDNKGYYQSNDSKLEASDIAGVLQIAKVLVKEARFSITAENTTTQKTLVNDSTKVTLMKGKLSSKDRDVNVNNLAVNLVASPALQAGETVDVLLSVNGSPFANITLNSTTSTRNFNSLGTIEAGKDMSFELSVIPTISVKKDIYLTVKAEGTDNNGNTAETSTEYSSKLEVQTKADYDVINTISSDRVIEPSINAVLYAGELDVKNGSMELTDFELTATDWDGIEIKDYKLYIDGEYVDTNSAEPKFSTLSENLEQGRRKVEVRGNVIPTAGSDPTAFLYNITDTKVNGTASGRSAKTYFAKGFFTLAKKSDSNGLVTIDLVNTSPKSIEVTSLGFDTSANLASASFDGANVSTSDGTLTTTKIVPANATVQIVFVAQKDKTVKLNAVNYKVNDNGEYTYKLDDTIGSVGLWGTFLSSK